MTQFTDDNEYFQFENVDDYRFYFRASGEGQASKISYFKRDMKFNHFCRWRWYLEYRAALLKVQNPRTSIHVSWGKYIIELEDLEKNRKNKIRSCKAKITEFERKLEKALAHGRTQLFSVDDHPEIIRFKERLERKRRDLVRLSEMDIEEFRKSKL